MDARVPCGLPRVMAVLRQREIEREFEEVWGGKYTVFCCSVQQLKPWC